MSTSVDDTTILEVLRANDDPRLTTTEVADQLPITRGRTRTRLQELVDDDKLKRTKEGNAVVWWLPEREDEIEAESEAEEGEAASEEAEPPDAEPDDAEPAEEEPTGTEAKEDEAEEDEAEEDEAEEDEAEEEEAEEPGDEAAEPEPPLADAPGAAEAETPSGETDLVDGPTVEEVGDDIAESMREGADVEGGEAAGPSAGDSDVLVESVESLDRESPGRTPGAETETRPAGERAPRMSREEGLRRLTMVAIVLSAIVILRKLLDRADGPDDR
jgi:hypothetical protein